MTKTEMKRRTMQFGLDIVRLVDSLSTGQATGVLGRQLLRAGTSVGANYRAACRAKSPADFISKMGTVEEEADEALYWMEMLTDAGLVEAAKTNALMQEADELIAMTVSSIKTVKKQRGA